MKLSCDFHIHTALSPCSDEDMTPGNIVGMAKLKNLDVIAITDHQSCGNVASAMKIGKDYGVIVIPGMELETEEEIHLICLFPTLENALIFEVYVKKGMPEIQNREDIFGSQWLYDENDEKISKERNLLLVPSSISYAEAFLMVDKLAGVCYPAHVDRESYSILSSFGLIPQEYQYHTLEISSTCNKIDFLSLHPQLLNYNFIKSSDAHSLSDILEPGMMVEVAQLIKDENLISLIIKALHQ